MLTDGTPAGLVSDGQGNSCTGVIDLSYGPDDEGEPPYPVPPPPWQAGPLAAEAQALGAGWRTWPRTEAQAAAQGLPVLDAWWDGRFLLVWCAHEHRWHSHGRADGPRSAHCTCPRSPLLRGGYYVAERGPLTVAVRMAHGRQWPAGRCCGLRLADGR
jgi:hypothetical protein